MKGSISLYFFFNFLKTIVLRLPGQADGRLDLCVVPTPFNVQLFAVCVSLSQRSLCIACLILVDRVTILNYY